MTQKCFTWNMVEEMKVLVGCEESQIVTKAFRDRGHEAFSCDLEPTRGNPDWHIQGDVYKTLESSGRWDLIILHPPCTAMAVSGNAWYGEGRPYAQKRHDAIVETLLMYQLALQSSDRVVLENPVSVIFNWLDNVQYIQPYQFGHPESKKTGLVLHNVPPLKPTKWVDPPFYGCKCGHKFPYSLGKYRCPNCGGHSGPAKPIYENQTPSGQNKLGPSKTRARDRSATYQGIADAMADQWGK